MTSLEKQLGQLEVDGGDFDQLAAVFKDPAAFAASKTESELENSRDLLLNQCRRSNSAAKLFDLLQANGERFLRALKVLGDTQTSVLAHVLSLQTEEEKTRAIKQVLHILKTLLKNHLEAESLRFYMQTYLNLVNEFQVVSSGDLAVILGHLTPANTDIQAVALFIVVKTLEQDHAGALVSIEGFFDYKLEVESDTESLLNVAKCLELLFALVPMTCSKIYTSTKCKDLISSYVGRITPASLHQHQYKVLAKTLLLLVSSSCIDDDCRKFNANTYLSLLEVGAHLPQEYTDIRLLSALCIVKLWSFLQLDQNKFSVTMDDLYDINVAYLKGKQRQNECVEYCIESLAYLTLSATIKSKIRKDVDVTERIVEFLRSKTTTETVDSSAVVYGLLQVVSNLMKITEDKAGSQESRTVNYLKSVATPKADKEEKEDPQQIHNFNKALVLDHGIVGLVSKLKVVKREGSNAADHLVSVIYYASTQQNKPVRQQLVKEGALNVLLDYLVFTSTVKDGVTRPTNTTDSKIEPRLQALRALAKILVSVNPALAFKKYSIRTGLPFLIELLGPDTTNYSGGLTIAGEEQYLYDHITMLDKYESLLALTNISSGDDGDVKDAIIAKSFGHLDNFIIDSDNSLVQRASWEVISNLIMKPKMLVKFFNMEDAQAKKRLVLLVKLMDSTDLQLQITLAGMVANATSEFDMIPQLLVEHKEIGVVSLIERVFTNQAADHELVLRLSYVLLDLVYAAANLGQDYLQEFKDNKAIKAGIAQVAREKNPEIMEVLVEVLKMIA